MVRDVEGGGGELGVCKSRQAVKSHRGIPIFLRAWNPSQDMSLSVILGMHFFNLQIRLILASIGEFFFFEAKSAEAQTF